MPFFTPKATRMANKRKRERKRNAKEQGRINAELQKQREDVLK